MIEIMGKKLYKKQTKEYQEKKLSKSEVIQITLAVIEIIFGGTILIQLFTVENSFNKQIQLLQQNTNNQMMILEEQISNSIEIIKNVDLSSTVENITYNYDALINETTDVETLLRYAQNAYVLGDYESVIQIYSMEKLKDNSVACNNMGYMFANGIYFSVNTEQADMYYDKAMKMGEAQAYYNKLALHIRHKSGDSIELMKKAYNFDESKLVEFVNYNLEKISYELDDEKMGVAESFIFSTPVGKQADILEQFYYWDKQGSILLDYIAVTSELEKYVLLSTERYLKDGEVQTKRFYDKYVRKCYGIVILNESWIWID